MPMRIIGFASDTRSALKSSIVSIISRAARTALSPGDGSGTGVPKITIRPSPIMALTMPPWPLIASNISVYHVLRSSIVSSGGCASASVVNPRMSTNITVASTRLPPSVKPESCRSCATSRVANRRTSAFCWSRSRFFSRLAPSRALSSTGFTGFCR